MVAAPSGTLPPPNKAVPEIPYPPPAEGIVISPLNPCRGEYIEISKRLGAIESHIKEPLTGDCNRGGNLGEMESHIVIAAGRQVVERIGEIACAFGGIHRSRSRIGG